MPEKYFDKFLESMSFELVLLEYSGVWYNKTKIKIKLIFFNNIFVPYD